MLVFYIFVVLSIMQKNRYNIIRKKLKNREFYSKFYKSFFFNQTICLSLRFKILLKKKINLYVCSIKNSCVITSRNRFVLSDFKLSRHEFRRQISKDLIPGIRKSSW